MKNESKDTPAANGLKVDRFRASVVSEGSERPHPASLALAKQPRATTRKNRRLTEFLRIERGIEA